MDAGIPDWLVAAHKKGMVLKVDSLLRVVIHKSVSASGSYAHTAETKKVPKDCHAYTWYPLTLLTILNSVCPGSPKRSRNLQLAESVDVPDTFIPDTP